MGLNFSFYRKALGLARSLLGLLYPVLLRPNTVVMRIEDFGFMD